MEDISPLNARGVLRRYGLRPDKRLGQNFLVGTSALQKIIAATGITPGETVLEVGPGLGALTCELAKIAGLVIAVELDERLISPLEDILAPYTNVQLIEGDILRMEIAKLIDAPTYLVVANIPYYITSALIRHLLEASHQPARMILTVQREVSQRICAETGRMNLLALSVQVYGKPVVVTRIPAGAFYPAPQVDSAVVRIDLYPTSVIPTPYLDTFFRLAKAGFSQKRKTLRNALAGGLHWSKPQAYEILQSAEIDPKRRAETLSLNDWERLARVVQV
jgi:16S rRNA (adenine1518-N6/adenine1519-N6)-dimethyltransferase